MANTTPDNISYPTNASSKKTIEGHLQDTATSVQTALNTKAPLSGAVFTGNLEVSSSGTLINGSNGTSTFTSNSSGKVPVVAKGASGQTANLQEWQNSSAAVVAAVDSGGRLLASKNPVFISYKTVAQGTVGDIVYNICPTNVGSHYNTTNGRFTAPVTGTYLFFSNTIGANTASTTRIYFKRNNVGYPTSDTQHRTANTTNFSTASEYTFIIPLNAGDYVNLYLSEGYLYGEGNPYSIFGGYLIG